MIAAAAAKPMTVLRIVLTPLLLEKPSPSGGNTAIPVVLPPAAIGVRRKVALDPQAMESCAIYQSGRTRRRTG
jgi:hypothetical protein